MSKLSTKQLGIWPVTWLGLIVAGIVVAVAAGLAAGYWFGEKAFSISDVHDPVLIINPRTNMHIAGSPADAVISISGDDHCPTGGVAKSGCVVLDKSAVIVHYLREGQKVTERWTVKNSDGKISLLNPNGRLVTQAWK